MRNGLLSMVLIVTIIVLLIESCLVSNTSGFIDRTANSKLDGIYNNVMIPDREDQTQTNYTGHGQLINDKFYAAQEFKPTLRVLTRVFLMLAKDGAPPNDLIVSIRGSLDDTDFTSFSIQKDLIPEIGEIEWVEVNFPDIKVDLQKSYYIVLRTIGGDSNNTYIFRGCIGNPYPAGKAYWSESNGTDWGEIIDIDFCFKTHGYNFNMFFVTSGFVTVDGTIDNVFHDNSSWYNYFACFNVSKVTIIGLGNYLPATNVRFYMKSFTNVSELAGATLRKLEVSDEYQHFIVIKLPASRHPLAFLTYEQ